jgi:hypothetical protein
VIGNKISTFFLVLVLLLSVTNLQSFSATQINSDSNHLNGLSIDLIGVAFADDDSNGDDSNGDDSNGDDSNGDDSNGDDSHGKKDKITICHIPPGNPDNAHTKSVSGNAKNAHLAHGDTMEECPDGEDNKQDDDGQDNITTITLTKQVTNDNQGTAGPDDFEISVNGAIVLSGSTTEVAPNVLFAINETAADGYAFVEITGDPECPDNLNDETITLAPGQDINCIIHNNDVGDATPDNEELSQLIDENKKLKEDIVRQEEQIDDLNEQIDFLSELIASIQGFFGNLFG